MLGSFLDVLAALLVRMCSNPLETPFFMICVGSESKSSLFAVSA